MSIFVFLQIWDLADPEGKGFLDKQGFYVALRLVACAQSGHEVTLSNLNLNMPPPKFVSAKILQVHLLMSSIYLSFSQSLSMFSLIETKFT